MTLPPRTVSLAECFNANKEDGNDKDSVGALHAGVQAGGRTAGAGGQSIAAVARALGVAEQTLFNWVKADRLGDITYIATDEGWLFLAVVIDLFSRRETLFGLLKVERLHGQRFVTRCQAKDEVIDWVLWYNRTRLHSTLAYVSPMRFE